MKFGSGGSSRSEVRATSGCRNGVGNIDKIGSVGDVIEQLRREYLAAKDRLRLTT
jgi:nitronate monooxygenase